MKTLNVSRPLASEASSSRFESAKALALSLAESDDKLIEPELIAWIGRVAALASPVLEGCSGPSGWHEGGVNRPSSLQHFC